MKQGIFKIVFLLSVGFASADTFEREISSIYLSLPDFESHYGQSTIENIRGKGRVAKYPNQDRALIRKLSNDQIVLGVFDGHGKFGDKVSTFVCDTLPDLLKNEPITKALFEDANEALQDELETKDYAWGSGTTSVVAVLQDDQLIVANTGDSRLLVGRNGVALFSTKDHKPNNPEELKRIYNAGGFIQGHYVYDIDGKYGLALSRGLGDVSCHRGDVVTAQPQVDTVMVKVGDFIVAASDGLFDVIENQEVIEFVQGHLDFGHSIIAVSEALTQEARSRGSRDDITALIVMIS
jgi:protein phosphatase 1L